MTDYPHITNSNGHVSRRAAVASAIGAAAFLGAGTAIAKVGEDAELLELFEEWKIALAACSGCEPDDGVLDDRCAIEQAIAATPAEGLTGIGVQLALWHLINQDDDVAADQALAAYDAVVRLTGRDFAAEAEAA
jgi:hypothetical protein